MNNTTLFSQKNPINFYCEKCDYKCSNKGDFNKHTQSKKHNTTNTNYSLDWEHNHLGLNPFERYGFLHVCYDINIQNQTLSILIFYFFFDCIPLFFAKNSDNLVIFYDFFTVVRIIAYIVRTRKYKIEFIFFIVAESLVFIQKLIFKLNLYQTARSIFSNCLLSLWIDWINNHFAYAFINIICI
jgi:hypothetical protein